MTANLARLPDLMSDRSLLAWLVAGMILALAFGIWAGLVYPGLYGKYESTGARARRRTWFAMLVDWFVRRLDR